MLLDVTQLFRIVQFELKSFNRKRFNRQKNLIVNAITCSDKFPKTMFNKVKVRVLCILVDWYLFYTSSPTISTSGGILNK